MRSKWYTYVYLAFVGLVVSILACNASTPVPQTPSPGVAPGPSSTLPPSETPLALPTQPTSQPATSTPTPQAVIRTLLPTVTGLPAPTSPTRPTPIPPTSTGPLDFPAPTALDDWRPVSDEYEVTIVLHIKGGAPPYTIHHDVDVFTTSETNPAIVFRARGCTLVHTILVESADGQSVKHDYWIQPPWCD